ncbi:hypothetical protein AX15_003099 [Amanita polypyramis BW_CC]|nr:hypothetical protein AX15_003099 [Amanita polypyramis BW_CC]
METGFDGQKKRKVAKTKSTTGMADGVGTIPTNLSESTMSSIPNKIDFRTPELPKKREGDTSDTASIAQDEVYKSPPIASCGQTPLVARPPSKTSARSRADESPSLRHSEAVNTDADDESSISGSVRSSGSIRRTEAERFFYFKNQPECAEVEPHRALCMRCNSFVNLGRKQKYAVHPWELHRTKCDARAGDAPLNTIKKDESECMDTESTATPSVAGRQTRRTESERKAWLEADSRAEEIQPEQVKCRGCKRWIRLSTKRPYTIYPWQKHQERCGPATPSSRVATAERKICLVNDAQVKYFDTRQVECLQCGRVIDLQGDHDYDLTKWNEHKVDCPVPSRSIVTESAEVEGSTGPSDSPEVVNSVPFPIGDAPAPDEEAPPTLESHPNINLKRARSPSRMAWDSDDDRSRNRPRRESYSVPNVEAPSTLDWFLQPLKAFVRGFRESLKGDAQSSSYSPTP